LLCAGLSRRQLAGFVTADVAGAVRFHYEFADEGTANSRAECAESLNFGGYRLAKGSDTACAVFDYGYNGHQLPTDTAREMIDLSQHIGGKLRLILGLSSNA
jgi:hypothetical protein